MRKTNIRPTIHEFLTRVLHKFFPDLVTLIDKFQTKSIEAKFNGLYVNEFIMAKANHAPKSMSQLGQDALAATIFKNKSGFYVEFGATDGISLSNTYMLEHSLSWTGVLAEPSREWHEELRRNRVRSILDYRAVWSESNRVLDFEAAGELGKRQSLQSSNCSVDRFAP